jgi:phospholipase C
MIAVLGAARRVVALARWTHGASTDRLAVAATSARSSAPGSFLPQARQFDDGHPASSKLDLFEALVGRVIDELKSSRLLDDTAVFVTFDEGGGYWDSGFFQPIDFFGDGPRIPMIAVSKYSRGGRVVHSYADHASVVKFIERNWGLAPLTKRSRDNLPNPIATPGNPYVPANMPAVSDLFEMFQFDDEDGR